jgi:RNA polymerase sigma factor (sigma-70 family)
MKDPHDLPCGESFPRQPACGETSTSLLEGLKLGDTASWERFCLLFSGVLRRRCEGRGVRTQDAEDIVQETLAAVRRQIGTFEKSGIGKFRGWLHTILKRKISDHQRSSCDPMAVGGTPNLQRIENHPDPVEALAEDEQEWPLSERELLARKAWELARCDFDPKTYAAARLRIEDELTAQEVVERLRAENPAWVITEGSVHTCTSRVKRRIREILEEFGIKPPKDTE